MGAIVMAEDTPAPDQETPVQDTPVPEVDAPTPDPSGTPEVDWQQRYTDLQPEYTRATQEAAELRQVLEGTQSDDPEVQQWAFGVLGLELAQQEAEGEQDPQAVYDQRLAELEAAVGQQYAAQEEQAVQAQEIDYMDQALKDLEGRIGRDLTEPEVKLLVAHATLSRTEEGVPGIEEAVALYDQLSEQQQAQWAQSKRTSTPAAGREGVEALDLGASHGDRVATAVEQLRANE